MDKPYICIPVTNFSASPFDIEPPENYQEPLNKETGEKFPLCCNFHRSIYEYVKKEVPNFLINHIKNTQGINNVPYFDNNYFDKLPLKVVTQITYTEDHISSHIESEDWYNDIIEYIEYNVDSFGYPQYGLSVYLGNLSCIFENIRPKISIQKKKKLIEFIEYNYEKNVKKEEASKPDINLLYSTYQSWLNIFPFELDTYFGSLKQHFEKQLPFINGQTKVNRYSYKSTGYLHTKDSLIESLVNLTNDLLTKINGSALYQNGLITDTNKIQLELLLNTRNLKLKQGYKNSSPNEEQRYRKMLKEWFKDEKKFFEEITPLVQIGTPQQISKVPILEAKPFCDYLNHENRVILAEKLKTEFNTEKGKGIKLMIYSLQENEPKLLSIGNRQGKETYLSLKKFFSQDIGTYQSIFDCKINKVADKNAIEATKAKIDFILQSISK